MTIMTVKHIAIHAKNNPVVIPVIVCHVTTVIMIMVNARAYMLIIILVHIKEATIHRSMVLIAIHGIDLRTWNWNTWVR